VFFFIIIFPTVKMAPDCVLTRLAAWEVGFFLHSSRLQPTAQALVLFSSYYFKRIMFDFMVLKVLIIDI